MKDMDKTMVEARDQFEGLLAYVEQVAGQETPLHEVERSLFRSLLALGRTLLVHFLQEKGVGDYGPCVCLNEGEILLRGAIASRPYRSIFGQVEIQRYVYGAADEGQAPLDAVLHLPEWKYSYLLQEWGLTFACKEAFNEAGQTLEQILGLGLAVGTLERLSRKASQEVDTFRAGQPAPDAAEEAPLLVATVDCKGVPLTRAKGTDSKQGKRRKKGEKKTQKKMACVGAVYTIDLFVRTSEDILDEVQRTGRCRAPARARPQADPGPVARGQSHAVCVPGPASASASNRRDQTGAVSQRWRAASVDAAKALPARGHRHLGSVACHGVSVERGPCLSSGRQHGGGKLGRATPGDVVGRQSRLCHR